MRIKSCITWCAWEKKVNCKVIACSHRARAKSYLFAVVVLRKRRRLRRQFTCRSARMPAWSVAIISRVISSHYTCTRTRRRWHPTFSLSFFYADSRIWNYAEAFLTLNWVAKKWAGSKKRDNESFTFREVDWKITGF